MRSISLDATIGNGNQETGPWLQEFFKVKSFRDIGLNRTPPRALMTFIDEGAWSINGVIIWGPRTNSWTDIPAANHQASGSLAFVDGHAELHKWKGSVTLHKISDFRAPEVLPGDPDVAWYRDHIGRRR